MEFILSQSEKRLATRIIIDLNGYDSVFFRKCENIFEIDSRLNDADAKMLGRWMELAISDVIELYTINPMTLYGTINIGPSIDKDFPEMAERYSKEHHEEFIIAYKTFATYAYNILGRRLETIISIGISEGYSDIACHLVRHRPGMLLIDVSGINPYG